MHLIKMASNNLKETLVVACLLLIIYSIPKAESLNCFVQDGPQEPTKKIDCQMHNACQKITNPKTQRFVAKSCFLTPGTNDTCFLNEEGLEVCWCHSDFCNTATTAVSSLHHWISALLFPFLTYHLVVT